MRSACISMEPKLPPNAVLVTFEGAARCANERDTPTLAIQK
jgi:hypothetical protein